MEWFLYIVLIGLFLSLIIWVNRKWGKIMQFFYTGPIDTQPVDPSGVMPLTTRTKLFVQTRDAALAHAAALEADLAKARDDLQQATSKLTPPA